MAKKLVAVCKELNISFNKVVDFLQEKGLGVSFDNMNQRIDDDTYMLLVEEFKPVSVSPFEGGGIQKASDEEIVNFFSTAIFEGVFSSIVKSSNPQYFKGHIHSIKLNGTPTKVIGTYINVPNNANDIPEGPCTFKCRVKEGDVRISPTQIKFSLSPKSLRTLTSTCVSHDDITRIKTRLRLENNQFIGQFCPSSEGWYSISDIRNTDFTKIEDKERGVKDITINFRSQKEFNRFAYYKFTWVLLDTDPLKFGIDLREDIIPVYPKDIVGSLYEGIMRYPAGAAKKIARSLDTLKKQLTQSGKEVFIYELLQNANDYPRHVKKEGKYITLPVDVEFHISNNYLIFQHTGEYFNPKNIAAICDINDGEKADNTEAIGYKGIGFKTVFLDNNYVLLNTGKYSFRFDKSATDVINTPWQILPIWSETYEIDNDVKSAFNLHPNEEFRVKFALQPREKSILTDKSRNDNYIDLFTNVFDSERVILFIPNIKKVSVYIAGQDTPIVREKDNKDWCVSEALIDDIPPEITEKINEVLDNPDSLRSDGYEKIPEKYYNFHKTSIKFACKKEGRKLLPVDDAILYCYLPAKRADWGFNFLMNTDMVPNGQRDDIEDIELNHEIAKIAGRQFFYWIKSLIESGAYELDSIFALIPDFEECKKKRAYKTFIEEFQEEFEELIKNQPFVPVVNADGNESYACIDEIINDETKLSAANIISDTVFINTTETGSSYLPIASLRESESFHTFLFRYSPREYDFDFDSLLAVCENDEFQEWLVDETNNVAFINFLLDKDKLNEFSDKTLFIEYEGELFSAGRLYLDFETHFARLDFFRNKIPHLKPSVSKKLSSLQGWSSFAEENFMSFDIDEMLEEYIFDSQCRYDSIKILEDKNNSIQFFKFIAEKNANTNRLPYDIPFYDEDGKLHNSFEGIIYFYSADSYQLSKEIWIPQDSIVILSHQYLDGENVEKAKNKFNEFGVKEFECNDFIYNYIVADGDFKDSTNEKITDYADVNMAFVRYMFSHRDVFKEKDNQLSQYTLRCLNQTGEDIYLCNDDIRYFAHTCQSDNSSYADNCDYEWLDDDMMYALHSSYIETAPIEDKKVLESFLRQSFGVKTFTDKSFLNDVVLANRESIYDNITTQDLALSFLDYLAQNSSIIFDGSHSFNELKGIPLLRADGNISSDRDSVLYEYDDLAADLESRSWYVQEFYLLDKIYSERLGDRARQLLEIKTFDIQGVLEKLCKDNWFGLNTVDDCIDFWRWIKSNQKLITNFDCLSSIGMLNSYGDWGYTCSELYIPDAFQSGGNGIEQLVKQFDTEAAFVSTDVMEDTTEKCREEWLRFLKKLGAKSDNKDLLQHILDNMDGYEDDFYDSIINLLTIHKRELIDHWEDNKKSLQKLKVRCRNGDFLPLDECIIVKLQDGHTEAEPFKYIMLDTEVAPEILKANYDIIIKIAESFNENNVLVGRKEWANYKIDEYINRIQEDDEERSRVHTQFIRDLAKWADSFELEKEQIEQIQFRVKGSNKYTNASLLTLGHAYKPACDFEKFHVDLDYLCDSYLTDDNIDILRNFFKKYTDIHYRFTKEDIEYMDNREFAIYVWTAQFKAIPTIFTQWIQDGEFDGQTCVPTATSVKAPEELYSPDIKDYVRYCNNSGDKIAAIDVARLEERKSTFMQLPFKQRLDSQDCLSYLLKAQEKSVEETEHRRTIINWLLENNDLTYDEVAEYRNSENAKWKNGRGEYVHISTLYAIHPDSTQESSVFQSDEHIIRTWSFPDTTEDFEAFCEMLSIQVLKSADFSTHPLAPVKEETAEILEKLKVRLLILAAIDNKDKYAKYYEKYLENIKQYSFLSCGQIGLNYGELHGSVGRIYVDEADSSIYYVSSWDNSRTYTKFCHKVRMLLGIRANDDICEEVFDESVTIEDLIDKYCYSLRSDKAFLKYMEDLKQQVIAIEEKVEEQELEDFTYDSYEDEDIDVKEPSTKTPDTIVSETDSIEDIDGDANDEVHNDNTIQETELPTTTLDEPITTKPKTQPVATEKHLTAGPGEEVVGEHYRSGAWVEGGYTRTDGTYVSGHYRSDTIVSEHTREIPTTTHVGTSQTTHEHTSTRKFQNTNWNRQPYHFSKEELDNMRSYGTPLELTTLPPTTEEVEILKHNNIPVERIADCNYIAQLRLYQNLMEEGLVPEESCEDFILNAADVTEHKLKGGKYIHCCSAGRGVLYVSPSIWNKVMDDRCTICVYYGPHADKFFYIHTPEELLQLVEKDDIVIKLTGKEKVNAVGALYNGILKGVKGTAYTLIRVAAHTDIDTVFAHYVGAMAETEDGNEDENDY